MATWYEFIGHYGYFAIFILFVLGIVGLPVPDEVLLTYLGYVTSIGKMHFSITFASAFIGALCGISISYYLGKKLGEPFLRKFGPKFFITEKTIGRTERLFDKYGKYMLFICYFIPGVRHVAAYIAGITYFSFKRFAIYAYSGAFVWVLTFLILCNRLGRNWHVIFTFVKEYVWILAALGVMAVISLGFYFLFFRRKRH